MEAEILTIVKVSIGLSFAKLNKEKKTPNRITVKNRAYFFVFIFFQKLLAKITNLFILRAVPCFKLNMCIKKNSNVD